MLHHRFLRPLNAWILAKDVVHAPRYDRVDVAAEIEAFSHAADELESDWGPL